MTKKFIELRERLLRAGVAPRHVRRYLSELSDHFADLAAEELRAGRTQAEAEAAARARLGSIDDLSKAMIEQRQFQSWSSRAPWATYGIIPLTFLAAAYFVACFILWSGWRMFLSNSATPFVQIPGPVYGFENIYFQTGRMIYFGAPVVIGWAIGLTAVRQRLKAAWPIIGLALVALIAGSAQVSATRPASDSAGHVSMSFYLGPSLRHADGLFHPLMLFTLTALPYLIWQLRQMQSRKDRSTAN